MRYQMIIKKPKAAVLWHRHLEFDGLFAIINRQFPTSRISKEALAHIRQGGDARLTAGGGMIVITPEPTGVKH